MGWNDILVDVIYIPLNGHKSIPAKVESGVPQGTVLGPALFIIYMNNVQTYQLNREKPI